MSFRIPQRSILIAIFSLCLVGVFPQTGQGEPASGVSFDGETAYTVSPEALIINPVGLTVAAWIRPDATEGSQVILNRGGSSELFTFYLYGGKVRMLVSNEEGKYLHADAPLPEAGQWTHYAGTYDGKTIKIYMDGKLMQAVEAPGRIAESDEPIIIGALNARERFFKGAMEQVVLWNSAVPDDVIPMIMNDQIDAQSAKTQYIRWDRKGLLDGEHWRSWRGDTIHATFLKKLGPLLNTKDDGYRGIWYFNQPSGDEYVYKYSGGMGTYCAKHIPHAWYCPEVNKTFFTYGGTYKDKNQLLHMVSYYDHTTGEVPRPTILLDKQTDDAHDNPVLNVDEDGYLWIFSSSHGVGRPSYISRSTKPYSIDEFELVWQGNFSYPQPWRFPGKGFLFVLTDYSPGGRTLQFMTSPDGKNWSERTMLAFIGEGHYAVSRSNRARIGIAFNYHPKGKGLNWRTNLYYIQSNDFGKTWHTISGEELQLPLTEPDNPALIVEYESKGLNVYMKDINYDAEGNPVILYITSKGYESGPENMPRTWTTTRWTGTQWDTQGSIVSDNNYDTGSLYIEEENLWRIIGPTEVGPQPYNPGGEMAMWESQDKGKSWKGHKITAGSHYNHSYARRPVNSNPDFYAFWADGHGRQPSDSRLYFCNRAGDVFRLPVQMDGDMAKPERIPVNEK